MGQLGLLLIFVLGLAGCSRQPSTMSECVDKYAKPGIPAEVATMGVQACMAELPPEPASAPGTPQGPFDLSMPTPGEMLFYQWRDLIGALPVTLLVWGLTAWLTKALLRRRLRWHLGVPSFLLTWGGTSLMYARYGEHPAIYFLVPLSLAIVSLVPILGAERTGRKE